MLVAKADNCYCFFDVVQGITEELENSSFLKKRAGIALRSNPCIVYDILHYFALTWPGKLSFFYEFDIYDYSRYNNTVMAYYLRQIAFLLENEKLSEIEKKIAAGKEIFMDFWADEYSYRDEIYILDKLYNDRLQKKAFSAEELKVIKDYAGKIVFKMRENLLPYTLENARQCIVRHKSCPDAFVAQLKECVKEVAK